MVEQIRRESRNYFCILATGEHFNVDQCVQSVPLRPSSVWRRGEMRNGSVAEHNGLQIDMGDGDKLDAAEQQVLAAEFLESNRDAVRLLIAAPGVTTCYLGLQESVCIDSLGSIMDISPRLMKVLLELELQLTIWSCTVGSAET